MDYIKLRLYMQNLHRILCEQKEYEEGDKWFTDLFEVSEENNREVQDRE